MRSRRREEQQSLPDCNASGCCGAVKFSLGIKSPFPGAPGPALLGKERSKYGIATRDGRAITVRRTL